MHLHGGQQGFDKKNWTIKEIYRKFNPYVIFSYYSEHLEENYPGNLKVEVRYEMLESNALKISYSATTDRPTIVNLTNHSHFNLKGHGTILDHLVRINSEKHLEINPSLLSTGKINSSTNTRFNYRNMAKVGKLGFIGLNDTYVLGKGKNEAALCSKQSGIFMKAFTNQPAIVVITPQQFPDLEFKDGISYSKYPSICFETQNFPDAPNNHNFPSSKLLPGYTYLNETVFDFTLK